jgi:cytochrome c biogenesis protein CcmG, thiol:disulfide interchange protein DsbE
MAQPDDTSTSEKVATSASTSRAVKSVADTTTSPNRSKILFGGAIAFVIAAGLTSVLLTKGNKSSITDKITNKASATASAAAEIAAVTVSGTALPAYPEDPNVADPAVGLTAPVLSGQTLTGEAITLPVPGKRTLIAVVAHWCPHCQREIPRIVQLQKDGKIPADLTVVLVSTSVQQPAGNYPPSSWLTKENVTFPVMADSATTDALIALGGMGFPNLHLIGADGKLVARHSGELEVPELLQFMQQ